MTLASKLIHFVIPLVICILLIFFYDNYYSIFVGDGDINSPNYIFSKILLYFYVGAIIVSAGLSIYYLVILLIKSDPYDEVYDTITINISYNPKEASTGYIHHIIDAHIIDELRRVLPPDSLINISLHKTETDEEESNKDRYT